MPIRFSPGGESFTRKLFHVIPQGVAGVAGVDGIALPAGVEMVSAVGTPTATGAALSSPAGVAMASALGSPSATGAALAAPSSVPATSSVGSPMVTGGGLTAPAGVAMLSAVGEAIASGGDVSQAGDAFPAGVEMLSSVGDVTATGEAEAPSAPNPYPAWKGGVGSTYWIERAKWPTSGTARPKGVSARMAIGRAHAIGAAGVQPAGVSMTAAVPAEIQAAGVQNLPDDALAALLLAAA